MKSCRAWSRRVYDCDENKVGISRVVPPWFRKTAGEAIIDTADQETTTKLPYRISFQTAPRGSSGTTLFSSCRSLQTHPCSRVTAKGRSGSFGRRNSVLRALSGAPIEQSSAVG